jgi:hypothetical protein
MLIHSDIAHVFVKGIFLTKSIINGWLELYWFVRFFSSQDPKRTRHYIPLTCHGQ